MRGRAPAVQKRKLCVDGDDTDSGGPVKMSINSGSGDGRERFGVDSLKSKSCAGQSGHGRGKRIARRRWWLILVPTVPA